MNKYRVERTLVVTQDMMADNEKEAIELAESQTNLASMTFIEEIDVKVTGVTEELKGLSAYERGVDDGFFRGTESDYPEGLPDDERAAYKRGYDHGVWMHCEMFEGASE
jgi:hypothetical protein